MDFERAWPLGSNYAGRPSWDRHPNSSPPSSRVNADGEPPTPDKLTLYGTWDGNNCPVCYEDGGSEYITLFCFYHFNGLHIFAYYLHLTVIQVKAIESHAPIAAGSNVHPPISGIHLDSLPSNGAMPQYEYVISVLNSQPSGENEFPGMFNIQANRIPMAPRHGMSSLAINYLRGLKRSMHLTWSMMIFAALCPNFNPRHRTLTRCTISRMPLSEFLILSRKRWQ